MRASLLMICSSCSNSSCSFLDTSNICCQLFGSYACPTGWFDPISSDEPVERAVGETL